MQPFAEIITYKTLHALCTTNKAGKMTVVFYASCLLYGPNPVWGVWNRNRRFLRFSSGREAIGKDHPHLAWRRVMTPWQLVDDQDSRPATRRETLAAQFNSPLPKPAKPAKPAPEPIAIEIPVLH